jgi:hypothetical protein
MRATILARLGTQIRFYELGAVVRLAGQAPAIGACKIGTRSPKRRQNRASCVRQVQQIGHG